MNSAASAPVRDGIVFLGVAPEKSPSIARPEDQRQFQFDRDKTVYVNHSYFYIDDQEFGPLLVKVCS
jgi:hypothetical protein